MNFENFGMSALAMIAVLVLAGEASSEIRAGNIGVEKLFEVVNGAIIVAIMGVTTVLRQVGGQRAARWIPLVPMTLGGFCGWLVSTDDMPARQIITWSLLYSGAASVGYLFVWKTIMKRGLDDAK